MKIVAFGLNFEMVRRAINETARELRLYPDPLTSQLVSAIAERFDVPEQCVFTGNGSDEVLALCFMAFFDSAKPIVFPDVTTEMPHELTKEERMSLLKYEDECKRYNWASKPQIRKYDHIHNGRISVGVGLKRRFRDGKSIILEEQLGDIMIAIFIAINAAKIAREEREEAERKRQEEQQRREELRKRYNEEVEHTLALENQAEDYAMACKIRALISAVESKGNDDGEIAKWIKWAKAKADWYDPTIAAEDEFFGERNHAESVERKRPKERYYW